MASRRSWSVARRDEARLRKLGGLLEAARQFYLRDFEADRSSVDARLRALIVVRLTRAIARVGERIGKRHGEGGK